MSEVADESVLSVSYVKSENPYCFDFFVVILHLRVVSFRILYRSKYFRYRKKSNL